VLVATEEIWLEDNIILTIWKKPLSADELRACFDRLARMLGQAQATTHLLFDLSEAGSVPSQAPVLALNSHFLTQEHTGKIAVVGMNIVAQILAQVATSVSKKDINFFPLYNSALAYLKDDTG
jgi:hypothetical protein